MGIRFQCPNGHKLHVKSQLAGQVGICPECQAKVHIPDPPADQTAPPEAEGKVVVSPPEPTAGEGATPGVAEPQAEPTPPAESAGSAPQSKPVPVARPVRPVAKAVARAAPAPEPPPPEPPPTDVWHLRTAVGEQLGPGDAQAFAEWSIQGQVTPDAYVWRAGWPEWKLVSESLAELPVVSTEPDAQAAEAVAQRESAAFRYVQDRKRAAKRQNYMALILLLLVVATAAAMVIVLRGTIAGPGPAEEAPPARSPAMQPAEKNPVEQGNPLAAEPSDSADEEPMLGED